MSGTAERDVLKEHGIPEQWAWVNLVQGCFIACDTAHKLTYLCIKYLNI